MPKYKNKNNIKEAVYCKAFSDLIKRKEGRNSDNAKGNKWKYQEFELPEYLGPDNEDMTIEEKKWMFRCRVADIDVKGNHRWKQQNISCFSCKEIIVETQTAFYFVNICWERMNIYHIFENMISCTVVSWKKTGRRLIYCHMANLNWGFLHGLLFPQFWMEIYKYLDFFKSICLSNSLFCFTNFI